MTLAGYQDTDLPVEEVVAGRIGFTHDLFMTHEYEIVDDLPPEIVGDVVVLTGRDDRTAKLERLADHDGRVVFVTAPGDAGFRSAYLRGRQVLPTNFVAAFVTNNSLCDGRVTNLPLGVRSNKIRHLKFVARNVPGDRDRLLYGNFALTGDHYRPDKDGRPHVRHRLVEQLADAAWATMDVSDSQRAEDADLVAYYANMRRHRFVLSPEGTGVDCYRHWEALYLGAIPIVMTSPTMTEYADLPILFTEDYSEITEDYLEEQWMRFHERRFEIRRLMKSFYRDRFLTAVSRLSSPRFLCWGFRGTDQEKFVDLLEDPNGSPFPNAVSLPAPPYIAPDSASDPAAWQLAGGATIERVDYGVRIVSGDGRVPAAQQRFMTLPGVRFRVSGIAHMPEPLDDAAVVVFGRRGREPLARFALDAAGECRFTLEFEAPAGHAVLAFQPGAGSSGRSLVLHELEVTADL